EEKEQALLAKKKALTRDISQLRELYEGLMAKFPHLQFEYKYPEKKWDPSHVKGSVVSLITLKDLSKAKALEAVAGGKLYNIIVDTEVTGKKLLEKGELKRRYTIIPLNKISCRCVRQDTLKLAQTLVGPANLDLALSLVEYESELQKAMEYVFGTTLICENMDNAKKVTFDKRIMTRSVTIDGEVFDPQGTLHGGNCWFYSYNNTVCACSQSESILSKIQEMKDIKEQLKTKEAELETVEKELARLKNVADSYQQLKQQWEMKSEEAELLQTKLHQSAYHKQEEELLALRKTIAECEDTLKKNEERQKKAEDKYEVLENKMKNAEAECDKELKNAQQKLDVAKKKADDSSKKMKEKQQEVEAVVLELEELKKEQTSYEEQIAAASKAIISYKEQVNAMEVEVSKTKESVEKSQKELAVKREVIALQDEAFRAKSAEIVKYREQINELQLKKGEKKSLNVSYCLQLSKMLKEYEWIALEKPLFGQPNTAYDFKANDPKEAGQKLQKLKEKKEMLGRNVNMRAMNMLSETEERYNDLMRRKRIVENDKEKILAAIEELDQKKMEVLYVAWKKVNEDFNSIFSMLLPGARATLEACKTHNVLVGLEFRVALGQTWKENLTELSGGQRSLVALSLILSMLLFKPAPIYILDEVDAALDLSHTQNIGQMLHTHFRHSQFIVVSLKDGMFNNANVLYKTKFVDGVSTVSRHDQFQREK
ncbi:Structural maintenance of chromosomes protein 2, partial [Podiceps cristatus]